MTLENTAGCRILVVEDETLITFEIEAVLEALECAIIGPVGTLEGALQLVHDAAPEAAILDVTVRGGKTYPVAEQLLAEGVPFVLSSGYEEWVVPETLRGQARLNKPFTTAELEEKVRFLCGEVAKRKRALTPNGSSQG